MKKVLTYGFATIHSSTNSDCTPIAPKMQAPYHLNVSMTTRDLPRHIVPKVLHSYITHLKDIALIDEKDFSSLPGGVKITQCVCLGLGNFTRPFKYLKSGDHAACLGPRNDSLLQLAALSIILEVLAKKHPVENVYFQDPKFTDFEVQFLRGLGYRVIEDPQAFSLVDSTTFLFAPVVCYDVWLKALEHASPALYIGNCVDLTMTKIAEDGLDYSAEEIEAALETLYRFKKESVAWEVPFCSKYWMGEEGSARVLLPKGKASTGR